MMASILTAAADATAAADTFLSLKARITAPDLTYADIDQAMHDATGGLTVREIKELFRLLQRVVPSKVTTKGGLIGELTRSLKELKATREFNEIRTPF